MAETVRRVESGVASVAAPIYLLLFPIPVVCFVAALVTDVAYSATAFLMWPHFSEWLIAAGIAFGALAALALLVEFFASHAIGEHGSWNRPELNGYKVVFIRFQDGRPVGNPIDFVTGFIKDGKARGRPVGVAVDGTGALIVADDVGNTVWRVTSSTATP